MSKLFRGAGAAFTMDGARERVKMALNKGCDVWLRIDYEPGQTLPPSNDEAALAPAGQDHGVENTGGVNAALLVFMAPRP